MSDEPKKPLYKTVDDRFTPVPVLYKLVAASLCLPPIMICTVTWQALVGTFRSVLVDGSEFRVIAGIFGVGCVCGLVGLFGGALYKRFGLAISAILAFILNALFLAYFQYAVSVSLEGVLPNR